MAHRKDYIGPTIGKHKTIVVPEGPVAELNNKTTKGMAAAKRLMSGEEPKVEGTPVKSPLRMGPPVKLPPRKEAPAPAPQAPVEKSAPEPVDPDVMLRTSHVTSYQTLLANDKMAKPPLKAWQD